MENDQLNTTTDAQSFAKSITSKIKEKALTFLTTQIKKAVSELIDLNDILTDIGKTSELTQAQLEELGSRAFDTAAKYGKTAADYLTSVRDMYRAGFDNAEELAELSLLAQSAGGLSADTADSYLTAANAAYDLKGNVGALTDILDGQTYIASRAAVGLDDMAAATDEAAATAARYGVQMEELSALIATALSKTGASGTETGAALASIFDALQDVDHTSVPPLLDSLGISMTEIENGAEHLKTPVELLRELSEAYAALDDGSVLKSSVLSGIGGDDADTLSAILNNWSSYEELTGLYASGSGSAMEAAAQSADNWKGSLNQLGNAWTAFIDSLTEQDAVINGINGLTNLLDTVTAVSDKIGALPTLGIGLGAALSAKNLGIVREYA